MNDQRMYVVLVRAVVRADNISQAISRIHSTLTHSSFVYRPTVIECDGLSLDEVALLAKMEQRCQP